MRRFLLESHTRTSGVGMLAVRLGGDDLDEIVENARLWALSAAGHTEIRILDRSVERLAVARAGPPLVDAIDRWDLDRPPLCPECGEMLHAAKLAGEPGWYCRSYDYRTLAA
ncbi:hypothetical protein ACQPZ2_30765 [Nocardia pseudovaccinii]|uniref:hypothetical protein n=1 Tax=Nocardia pseudovaccinii TaxID=189540 RepID=UPI003D8AF7DA